MNGRAIAVPPTPIGPATGEVAVSPEGTMRRWLDLVRSEYLEVPGLSLNRLQAQRFWSLDAFTCEAILDALIAAQFLRLTPAGTYVLADRGVY
jgi:hypothetical protein